jgi:hypothetical protein
VLLEKHGKISKMALPCTGPCEVLQAFPNGSVCIQHEAVAQTVNMRRPTPFHETTTMQTGVASVTPHPQKRTFHKDGSAATRGHGPKAAKGIEMQHAVLPRVSVVQAAQVALDFQFL